MEFVEIGSIEEFSTEERVLLQAGDREILLLKHDDSFFAVENVCSHDGEALGDADVEDGEIICPRHGARFSLTTGDALTLPAVVGVPVYPVRRSDGKLFLGFPEE